MSNADNHLYRLGLYTLCRYAAGWRGMWRFNLDERALEYRFPQPGTLVTTTKWGIPIEVRKNDAIGHMVYFFGDYERKLLAAAKRELQPGDVALDIGANIGVVSLYCATLVGKTGHVFAVEALKQNHDLLGRNILRAGLTDVIHMELCALGAEEKSMTLRFDEQTDNWGNTSLLHQSGAGRQEVAMHRLDTLWEKWGRPRIQFVKLDVEGFENEVVQGATRLMAEAPPKAWVVEFNLAYLSAQANGVENLWNFFASRGYTPYHMKTQARLEQPPTQHCDVLFRLEKP